MIAADDLAAPPARADAAPIYALAPEPRGAGSWLAGRADGLYQQQLHGALAPDAGFPLAGTAVTALLEHEGWSYAAVPGGILRGAGGGWLAAPLATAPTVSALCASRRRAGLLLAATLGDGVLRSEDSGASWAAWNFGLLDRTVLALGLALHGDAERLYAGTESGLFYSATEGRSWAELFLPFAASVAALAVSADTLLAGSEGAGLWLRSLTVDEQRQGDGGVWRQIGEEAGDTIVAIVAVGAPDRPAALVLTPQRCFIWAGGATLRARADAPAGTELSCLAVSPAASGSWAVALGTRGGDIVQLHLRPEELL